MRFNVTYILILAAILSLTTLGKAHAQAEQKELAVGDKMPAFALTDQNGKPFKSADYVGKNFLVIYFYPKDESMVCTKEACQFRDSFNDFTKAGAKVIGINAGTVESHKNFTDHYKLPFILLSDPDNMVYHKFGVKNKMFMTGRQTFVVDKDGKIAFTYTAIMQGKKHADDALAFVRGHK
ncbi:MAG: peroxiredoxin [Mucilaginibacter sp.]